nr:MAG TPA: hypothetical protein [Caudoviricetes sp.]
MQFFYNQKFRCQLAFRAVEVRYPIFLLLNQHQKRAHR